MTGVLFNLFNLFKTTAWALHCSSTCEIHDIRAPCIAVLCHAVVQHSIAFPRFPPKSPGWSRSCALNCSARCALRVRWLRNCSDCPSASPRQTSTDMAMRGDRTWPRDLWIPIDNLLDITWSYLYEAINWKLSWTGWTGWTAAHRVAQKNQSAESNLSWISLDSLDQSWRLQRHCHLLRPLMTLVGPRGLKGVPWILPVFKLLVPWSGQE